MKKTKIISVLLSAVLLIAVCMPVALGASILDDVKGLMGIIGMEGISADQITALLANGTSVDLSELLSNSGGIVDVIGSLLGGAAGNATNTEIIGAITSLLGGNSSISLTELLSQDFLDAITAYLAGENITTAETTTRELPTTQAPTTQAPTTQAPTTEAPTTQVPTTEAPTQAPSTTRNYTPPTTTEPNTTVQYVAPEYYTTQVLAPDSQMIDVSDVNDSDEGISVKMIIGIVILVLSGAAVVAVAIVLKKTRV